ncbi:hypothetical protein [Paracnuella aquatica]|uniref:hypothetical protein n=1 Tax=Paracnuella aquatica TaxID=2268757 RepID=UPI000DF01538|nr:hypothetical protein [Paracnuella aquatica]RPD50555.1 hypothetical protein DRJ53_06420 [Paracnuella aquatica]
MSRNNSRGAVGALHPILFFVFVYGISLALAFFICNAVYNSMLASGAVSEENFTAKEVESPRINSGGSVTAMR